MVGIEGMTGAVQLLPGLAFLLVVLGAACGYAAFFWESAKKVLSVEAQAAIGRFAQSRFTWAGMLFLVLLTVVLSPFIEQHRWPFSYPTDPGVYERLSEVINDRNTINNKLTVANYDALRWRGAYNLRYETKAGNGSLLDCRFNLSLSHTPTTTGVLAFNLWSELSPILEFAHWQVVQNNVPRSNEAQLPLGFTISVGTDSGDIFACAAKLTQTIGSIFPSQKVDLRTKQVTPALLACKNECVELEIGH